MFSILLIKSANSSLFVFVLRSAMPQPSFRFNFVRKKRKSQRPSATIFSHLRGSLNMRSSRLWSGHGWCRNGFYGRNRIFPLPFLLLNRNDVLIGKRLLIIRDLLLRLCQDFNILSMKLRFSRNRFNVVSSGGKKLFISLFLSGLGKFYIVFN